MLIARFITGYKRLDMLCADVILPECAATERLRQLFRSYSPYIQPRTFTTFAGQPMPPTTVPSPESSPQSRGEFSEEDSRLIKEILADPELSDCLRGKEFMGELSLISLHEL
jgi:hypothetical protein